MTRVGCAGWSIPKEYADRFPGEGSHLARYSRQLPAVEINTSFYRPHRPSTYAHWASESPEGFSFSIKVPKEITHTRKLVDGDEPLNRFLDETSSLGTKRGPLLVQLPPSLDFRSETVGAFFAGLRERYAGPLACEPRHPSWFADEVDRLLSAFEVARVAADPAVVPRAAEPGGWDGLIYYRWHGSPKVYYSAYPSESLDAMAARLMRSSAPAWCIFDNTALGAATEDALGVLQRVSTPLA